MLQVVAVNGDDLVAATQLSAQISRSSSQDEGDEDSFAILTADNVESQAGRTFR